MTRKGRRLVVIGTAGTALAISKITPFVFVDLRRHVWNVVRRLETDVSFDLQRIANNIRAIEGRWKALNAAVSGADHRHQVSIKCKRM